MLAALNDQVDQLSWVELRDRGKQGAIKLTALEAHVAPYGEVRLNMDRRLSLRAES